MKTYFNTQRGKEIFSLATKADSKDSLWQWVRVFLLVCSSYASSKSYRFTPQIVHGSHKPLCPNLLLFLILREHSIVISRIPHIHSWTFLAGLPHALPLCFCTNLCMIHQLYTCLSHKQTN